MITRGGLTKIVAEEPTKIITLATVFPGKDGPVYGQPADIEFREGRGGVFRSSLYQVGLGNAHSRVFRATPKKLQEAFDKAGIPARILTRKDVQAGRADAAPRLAA